MHQPMFPFQATAAAAGVKLSKISTKEMTKEGKKVKEIRNK